MNGKTIKILVCAILAVFALSVFAGCAEGSENTTSTQSETNNPFGNSFTPTNPGDSSLENAAGGLQNPSKYESGQGC